MVEDAILEKEWHIAALSSDVKEGSLLGLKVMGVDIVLWRVDGEIVVWKDLCIHRGTKLSLGSIEGGCVVCPYHGWEYDKSGACVRIPAQPEGRAIPSKASAFPLRCVEKYKVIWVCFGEPESPEPVLPIFDGIDLKLFASAHPLKAKATRVIENYLDFSHLPYLHGGYLGDPDMPQVDDYSVDVAEDGSLSAYGLRIWQPDPDGTGVGGYRSYDYYCYRPLVAAFTKEKVRSVLVATPVDDENTVAWLLGMSEDRQDISEEEAEKWSSLIIGQDAIAVESQRPELLPLDLQEELHLACDRLAIAYRRWLKKLGMEYGVS